MTVETKLIADSDDDRIVIFANEVKQSRRILPAMSLFFFKKISRD
ncbi:MAG: hypothetical protein PHX25_00170 [Candidatus Pacebacteria bacterium]|nr:hypothetical protein [Candidatus Paceibacterota bacterium]